MNNHQKSTFQSLGNFLNPTLALPEGYCVALTLLELGLRKSPIEQKLNFDDYSYLRKGLLKLVAECICRY